MKPMHGMLITCGSLEVLEGCFPQSTHSPHNELVLVWIQSQVTFILCIGGDKCSCAAGNALTCGEQDREREREERKRKESWVERERDGR